MQQQQRNFGIFTGDKTNPSQLFLDETFLKEKESFFELFLHEKDHERALKLLEDPTVYRDEEMERIQRAERLRLKAKLYIERGCYNQAN